MSELGISLTNEQIQGVSKNVFNNFVKKKIKLNMLKYFSEKKKSHSKAKYLNCENFQQAEYIRDSRFTTFEKQLLFKLRSKTLDVKENFKGLSNNLWCTSCGLFRETQGHLLQCPELVSTLNYLDVKPSKLNENFIYGNIEQQQQMVKIYTDVLDEREILQESRG